MLQCSIFTSKRASAYSKLVLPWKAVCGKRWHKLRHNCTRSLHIHPKSNICKSAYRVHAHIWRRIPRSSGRRGFPASPGLPAWIREEAALPALNVSWCLPGCLFGEKIKGGPLPLAPTNREWGTEEGGEFHWRYSSLTNKSHSNKSIDLDRILMCRYW